MAISRIPGYSLLSDLDRQGIDLQFTTNSQTLAYLDFANYRLGINTTSPQEAVHVIGNILLANNLLNSGNLTSDLGSPTNWWRTVYANAITVTYFAGTITSSNQPYITQLGTLSNLTVTGNIIAGNINASVFGNVSGYVLSSYQPYITNLNNITVGNILVSSNLRVYNSLAVNNAISGATITQNGNPVLDSASTITVTGNVTGSGTASSLALTLSDTGVTPGVYGSIHDIPVIDVDRRGRITSISSSSLNKIGNVYINDTTFTSNTDLTLYSETGSLSLITANNNNIVLNATDGGMVQVLGSDAMGIPAGNTASRPSSPGVGYIRFNTDLSVVEYYTGTVWDSPSQHNITSVSYTPDGVGNSYVLSHTSTAEGLLVSINGTIQQPGTSYHVIGDILYLEETPLVTDAIEVRQLVTAVAGGGSGGGSGNLASGNTSIDIELESITFNAFGTPTLRMTAGGSMVGLVPSVGVSSGTTATIDEYNKAVYRSAKYLVQASTLLGDSETSEVLLTHDGSSNAYNVVYGTINTGTSLGTISSTMSGSLVQLKYTAAASSVSVKISKNYLTL